jgi:hypothetical protein
MQQPVTHMVEQLLTDAQPMLRAQAAENLGNLEHSNAQIVHSLICAQTTDRSFIVQHAAARALQSPAHQRVLQEVIKMRGSLPAVPQTNGEVVAQWVAACVPLALVVILSILVVIASPVFLSCDTNRCLSIPGNPQFVLKVSDSTVKTSDANTSAELSAQDDTLAREQNELRYSGRTVWFLWTIIFTLAALSAFTLCVSVFFSQDFRRSRWICGVLSLAGAFTFGIILYNNPNYHIDLIKSVADATIGSEYSDVAGVYSVIITTINLVSSYGHFVGCLIVCMVTVVLWEALEQRCQAGDGACKAALEKLSQKMAHIRSLLFGGALLLTIGIFVIQAIYQWALAYVDRSDIASAAATAGAVVSLFTIASRYVSVLTNYYGLLFSAFLAVTFLPATFIVHRHALQLLNQVELSDSKQKTLEPYGLAFTFTDSAPRAIAILAPLLTTPLAEFTKALFSS